MQQHGDTNVDFIVLSDMVFYGYHGALPAEKSLGQRFVVDLRMGLDLLPAGQNDDLGRTVHYGMVYGVVRQIMEGPPLNLIEAVAQRIASSVLSDFPLVQWVEVTVKKPEVAIAGSILGYAGVHIRREAAAVSTPP